MQKQIHKSMQQMSCRWRLLGMKKKRDQFQNLEGKSQHFVLSVACSQKIFDGVPMCIRLLVAFFVHEKHNCFMRLMGHQFAVARN